MIPRPVRGPEPPLSRTEISGFTVKQIYDFSRSFGYRRYSDILSIWMELRPERLWRLVYNITLEEDSNTIGEESKEEYDTGNGEEYDDQDGEVMMDGGQDSDENEDTDEEDEAESSDDEKGSEYEDDGESDDGSE
jgi:hypothetical protein